MKDVQILLLESHSWFSPRHPLNRLAEIPLLRRRSCNYSAISDTTLQSRNVSGHTIVKGSRAAGAVSTNSFTPETRDDELEKNRSKKGRTEGYECRGGLRSRRTRKKMFRFCVELICILDCFTIVFYT